MSTFYAFFKLPKLSQCFLTIIIHHSLLIVNRERTIIFYILFFLSYSSRLSFTSFVAISHSTAVLCWQSFWKKTTINIEDIINILGLAVDLLSTIVDVILHTAKPCKKKHRIKVEPPASRTSKAVRVCAKRKHKS